MVDKDTNEKFPVYTINSNAPQVRDPISLTGTSKKKVSLKINSRRLLINGMPR